MEINPSQAEWLLRRVLADPEGTVRRLISVLEETASRRHTELHQAIREANDLAKIKLAQGRLDGVQDVIGLLGGLMMSETKKPPEAGLMPRIFGLGRK